MQLALLGALMVLGTVTEVVSLGMVLPFLGALAAPSRVFEHPWAQPMVSGLGLTTPQEMLLPLTILFVLAAVLAGATRLAFIWVQTRLGNAIGADLGAEAYRRTLYQTYAVHSRRNSSEVVAVLTNKINTVVYFIIIPLLALIASIAIVLTMVTFMILVDPALTVAALLGFGIIYLGVAGTTKTRLVRYGEQVTAEQSNVTRVVQEGLGGIRDVLLDGLQETYTRLYRQSDGRLRRALANIAILGGIPRPVIESLGLVLIGGLAYMLLQRPDGMAAAVPMLGVLALAAQRLLPLVQQAYAGWTSMLGGQGSLRDVLTLLEQPMPLDGSLAPPEIEFRRCITLNEVCFRYEAEGPWIVGGVDLQIDRGSRVGFLGSTGSGKSTLLDLIMGLLSPVSGTVCIDNVIVNEANHRAWQTHVAHVPQSIFLADATIVENIAFGVPAGAVDRARVRLAAERAQIAATIDSWPDGFDTVIGERGVRLSGGQRQRLGIARALYKDASVLVLDEATSALDAETEQAVMDAIESLSEDLTILIVAHRVTTLRNCTKVIELVGGRVARIGSYDSVVTATAA
jgi:ATP-binding cassette subfamily B protein